MDSSDSNQFDIFDIYRRYCEILHGTYACGNGEYKPDDELQRLKSREPLADLLKLVESRMHVRNSIFDEIFKLMSRLDLTVDFLEFSRFYDFVFFICRENGQKNITVSRAVASWRLVLAGRFRLLNRWCDFVEKNQRHNISEDTWKQVLVFSRCVHENLEGYDPEGAWPVLIDDFVEHMYRITGSNKNPSTFCNCDDLEAQSCDSKSFDDSLPGLKNFPGLKRRLCEEFRRHGLEASYKYGNFDCMSRSKRRHCYVADQVANCKENPPSTIMDDCMDIVKHNGSLGCSRSPCAVEGCLSKGFAGLFSGHSGLQFDEKRRVSYT